MRMAERGESGGQRKLRPDLRYWRDFLGKKALAAPVGWKRKDPRFQCNMWSAIREREEEKIELIAEVGAIAMPLYRAASLCESCGKTY